MNKSVRAVLNLSTNLITIFKASKVIKVKNIGLNKLQASLNASIIPREQRTEKKR